MEYLIPAALVLLVVTAFVVAITLYTTRKGGAGSEDRSAADATDASPGPGADDATDLGDTDQLHDVQRERSPGATGDGGSDADESLRPESEKLADRSF